MIVCVNCAKFRGCNLSSPNVNECADYKEILTNEEWFCSLTTEEKAEFLRNYTHDIIFDWKGLNNPFLHPFPFKNVIGNECTTIDGWVEWLKQPHKDGEL